MLDCKRKNTKAAIQNSHEERFSYITGQMDTMPIKLTINMASLLTAHRC